MDNLENLAEGFHDTVNANLITSTSFPRCTSPRVPPSVRQRNFVAQTHDAALYFQILDLGRQYFVWVSALGPKLGNLYMAIKTPADNVPAVASLMPAAADGGPGGEGLAMAQRLALKLGKPVLCSCNMPQNAPLLQAVAERRLLQELQAMQQDGEGAAPTSTATAAAVAVATSAAGEGLDSCCG